MMKKMAANIFLMSIVLLNVSSYVYSSVVEKDCKHCASTVEANWSQFFKYACFGSGKLFLAYKLYTVVKEGYATFKDECGSFKKLRYASEKSNKYEKRAVDHVNINQNQKTNIDKRDFKKLEKSQQLLQEALDSTPDLDLKMSKHVVVGEGKDIIKKESVKKYEPFSKIPWKNLFQWNYVVSSLLTFVGAIDLYNCFKIARAMYNKEKMVRLEIHFPIK